VSAIPSPDTQASLLLTQPLGPARTSHGPKALGPREFWRLAELLQREGRTLGGLLEGHPQEILARCETAALAPERIDALLGRGETLAEALGRWRNRGIWVLGSTDPGFPKRLRERLDSRTPPVLYGTGPSTALELPGLGIVGSRDAEATDLKLAADSAELAARAGRTVISGGARGVDSGAMRGALEAGGRGVGVVADALERAARRRQWRAALDEGRLTLVSLYDPGGRFTVGKAMERNRVIYALSAAVLVSCVTLGRGGTWAGSREALEGPRARKMPPVYVPAARADLSEANRAGIETLKRLGAHRWPDPKSPEELESLLVAPGESGGGPVPSQQLSLTWSDESEPSGSTGSRGARPKE